MKLNSYKKILIVRLSSLGDILLSTPLIRTLKTTYPELQIDFLLRKEYESTLKFNPHIENLLTIDRNYNRKKLNYSLKSKSYDLIIDLQNNLRSHPSSVYSFCHKLTSQAFFQKHGKMALSIAGNMIQTIPIDNID